MYFGTCACYVVCENCCFEVTVESLHLNIIALCTYIVTNLPLNLYCNGNVVFGLILHELLDMHLGLQYVCIRYDGDICLVE